MDKVLHEIWRDPEGLPCLIRAGVEGEGTRKRLIEEGSRLVHTFYASSHFEAMTYYYAYVGYGEYKAEYEYDKLPYSEWAKIKGPWK
ncbi:MAG TPA: hypothetical protein VHK91_03845 [Flavisolibacter sp.]|jgi:hypothetical protein|nr:hypothetical protein [Flavisolibacter sp.]